MRRSALALAALLVPIAVFAADKPRAPKQYTIEQFMKTTAMGGASFSADDSRILFHSNETGIFNAYSVPVAGGKPTQLTQSKETTQSVSYFPDDDRILYTRDQGGNEQNHLYVRERDGSERDLTPGEKLKAQFAGWRPDGKVFYVLTNERDPKAFDVYRYDAGSYERTMMYKNEKVLDVAAISRDENWIALAKINTNTDLDIYLFDVSKGELKHITPHKGSIKYNAETFDPQSKRLFLLSDEGSEFTSVRTYDLATGAMKEHEKADWDVVFTYFSRDGRFRVTGVNQDGRTTVRVVEGADEKPLKLEGIPAGELRTVRFDNRGRQIAFYVNGDRAPSDLYVYDLASRKATRLTKALNPEINADDLVDTQVVRFKSFDGMVIPSIYFKPQVATPANRVPAVLLVHGGPGGQSTRGYNSLAQFLANHGYAVLAINNRGSSGYGKTFFAADDQKHGREPLWDCIEAKTFLASLGHVDPAKIGIMGGSYGGYMVLAALAFRPESFKVGVDIFGVSNWLRTLESIPPYWESFRLALYQEIGDPVKDKEMLIAASPLFHAKNIIRPLYVVQGANDPRVIKPESDEIVEAVKKNGVPVEYVVFPDEGHGFSKKANSIKAYQSILEFLDKYLKNG
ncbi:MAG TPA: S9 family peptidase [Usitatibacter sp.]|nr:S9 family peptidase [Usitatibacter sp.]